MRNNNNLPSRLGKFKSTEINEKYDVKHWLMKTNISHEYFTELKYLFDEADKKSISEISKTNQPFTFTLRFEDEDKANKYAKFIDGSIHLKYHRLDMGSNGFIRLVFTDGLPPFKEKDFKM